MNLYIYILHVKTLTEIICSYVLTDYLLTPLRVERDQADHNYNKWHRKTRSKVERLIGQIKQRLR